MDDLIARLRKFSLARSAELRPNADAVLADEAAARIERLRMDNIILSDELEILLKAFDGACDTIGCAHDNEALLEAIWRLKGGEEVTPGAP
jgi:hypothetical protein